MDPNSDICLVDVSYNVFYRFFALRQWYKRAHPDKNIPDNYDWLADEVFMTKYRKLFFENIFKVLKKRKIKGVRNFIFAVDCHHKNIWRYKYLSDYKGTRSESHQKNNFYSFGIFEIVYRDILPSFFKQVNKKGEPLYRGIIISKENAEADDIIACSIPHLHNKYPIRNLYIMASDTDYVQLCDDHVFLFTLQNKDIGDKYITNYGNKEKYLIYKLLIGDTSDNIEACHIKTQWLFQNNIITRRGKSDYTKCTPTIAKRILDQTEVYQQMATIIKHNRDQHTSQISYQDMIKDTYTQNGILTRNQLLIDMKMIPHDINTGVIGSIESYS